jgi:hypothetical protein
MFLDLYQKVCFSICTLFFSTPGLCCAPTLCLNPLRGRTFFVTSILLEEKMVHSRGVQPSRRTVLFIHTYTLVHYAPCTIYGWHCIMGALLLFEYPARANGTLPLVIGPLVRRAITVPNLPVFADIVAGPPGDKSKHSPLSGG